MKNLQVIFTFFALCNCQIILVYGQRHADSCKTVNVGGLTCATHYNRIPVAYKFTNLSCIFRDEHGEVKLIKGHKLRNVELERFYQSHPKEKTDNPSRSIWKRYKKVHPVLKRGQQAKPTLKTDKRPILRGEETGHVPLKVGLRLPKISFVFRIITIEVARSCLNRSVDDVKVLRAESTKHSETATLAGNGYIRLGVGKNLMYLKRFNIKRSWDQALNVCQSETATLVKIDSKEKMNVIKEKMTSYKDKFTKFSMWISLRDFSGENVYEWLDRSPYEFTNWQKYQPDFGEKAPNGKYVNEDCVALVPYFFEGIFWADLECDSKHGFICERKLT